MALKVVEEQIAAARERGEFDNLPGRGKPLDHSGYFAQPESLRVAHHLLHNAGFVPPEVELLRERGELRERLERTTDAEQRKRLQQRIERLSLELDLARRTSKRARR